MKIEILGSNGDLKAFVDAVNEFIAGKNVIDIKYTSSFIVNKYGNYNVPESGFFADRALIMYEPDTTTLYADDRPVATIEEVCE